MSTIKLFGFTSSSRTNLLDVAPGMDWAEGLSHELSYRRPSGEVWVVASEAIQDYVHSLTQSDNGRVEGPKAVLWVSPGQPAAEFDDWWQDFHAQLICERPSDQAFLARISRCDRVLDWSERLEDLSEQAVCEIAQSVSTSNAEGLFEPEEWSHLVGCTDCRAHIQGWARSRQRMNMELLCPSTAALSDWLCGSDSDIETHIHRCTRCLEAVSRHAGLLVDMQFLDREAANARLHQLGIYNDDNAWLSTALRWQESRVAAGLVVLLAFREMARRSRLRTSDNADDSNRSDEDVLIDQLSSGAPITLTDESHWLLLRQEGDVLTIRAGQSATERHAEFTVEFRKKDELAVSVKSEDGVAHLSREHLDRARGENADSLAIVIARDQR